MDVTGGYTDEGVCVGAYRMDNGSVAHDTCLKIIVVCDERLLAGLRKLARKFAGDFKQESIYFEYAPTTLELIRAE
jgi:hypothetical protein